MASSCTTIPTLTRTTAVTTQSTSTIVSSSVTTSPPSTTSITSIGPTCSSVSEGSTTCQITTQVTNSTISGATSTVGITQTTVVPITSSVVNTYYSTSCTRSSNSVITSTSSSSSSLTTITMTSMLSSTAANGSVLMTQVTETLTYFPPTSSTSLAGAPYSTSTTSLNLAPIIGGSVGGFFGLSAIVLLGWYLWKRKQKWDNLLANDPILNDAFPKPKRDPALDAKPKPYQYGIVGHSAVPPHMSPPPSTGLSLSSEGPNAHPLSHNPPPSQQQSAMPQAQQSVAQQQQQSVTQQSQNQSVGSSSGQQAVMQQQQQAVGPSSGQQLANPQTYGASSFYNHTIPAAASLSSRPSAISSLSSVQDSSSSLSTISAPGPWVNPGVGRYPPGMQRNLSVTAGVQAGSRAGAALGTGQRQSTIDENEVYGGITMDTPVAGSSGAVPIHGNRHPPGMGSSGTGPGQDFSEFNPYHEPQQPAREQRDGKGRLVKVVEKQPPVVHLDGGRYRAPVLSPGPGSLGNESVMAPPAYSA